MSSVRLYLVLSTLVCACFTESSTEQIGLLQSSSNYPCTDKNHLLLTPGSLASGANSRICLSRFHTKGAVHLALTLNTEDGRSSNVAKELPEGDGGCVDIIVPQQSNTNANLSVQVRYPDYPCTWTSKTSVRISSSRVVIVSSERGRYRGGEIVKLRVTALKSDLTPVHAPIDDIWLEGPSGSWGEGVRVTQWKRVRSRFGIAQVQYRLEPRAVPGKWRARVRLSDGSQGSSEFVVGDYKLPPFQLTVKHLPKVLRTAERLVWTVCVRYPWSEAVEGILAIRLRSLGAATGAGGVRTAVRLRSPRACHRHAAAGRRVGLGGAGVVVADFSFQEDGTGIWQNTTVVSQVVDQPVTLEILSKQLTVIVPGLPYKLTVKATRWDNKPAMNELVRVCNTPTNDIENQSLEDLDFNKECNEATTDVRGVARVVFATNYDSRNQFYKFVATLKNNTEITSDPLYLPVRRSSVWNAAFGTLVGNASSPGARVFVPLYLNVKNVKRPITVHFVVITRGGTIYRWGATTQCPTANAKSIYTTTRESYCDDDLGLEKKIYEQFTEPDRFSELARHLSKVMLPVRLSHQMCPNSHLVAYFYFGGELVSASKRLEVEECFVNKVEATWSPRQVQPGSSATLNLSTTPSSFCALTALDVASKWLQDPGPSVKESIMAALARVVAANRNVSGLQAMEECFYSSSNKGTSSSSDFTVAWLAEAGVKIAGGDAQHQTCEAAAPLTSGDGDLTTRSEFFEAWLWRLVVVGSNGTAAVTSQVPDSITRFEATAFCVSRIGIALSQPAVLQVFQEFFIHADAPKKLRRGDTTVIQYRIFNYLYEPLAVQIQILADPHLEIVTPVTESACIAGRASIARRLEMRAREHGEATVSVRAIADYDRRCGNHSGGGVGRVSDEVNLKIDIEHEGIPVREYRSTLLCGRDSNESSDSTVTWSWPRADIVSGTESLKVWAVGDLTGPLLADADALTLLPRGCGEQNLARMATNLLALKRLDPRSPAFASAKDHVARGYARQLQYAHQSGGFSAFGETDGTPSTWLTAFAVRYMSQAQQLLNPGSPAPAALDRAESWLLAQQMENGCFRNEGHVFHRELKGGLSKDGETANVALTAYVISSLVESATALPSRVVRNALSCLRAMPTLKAKKTGVYAHTLLAHAYTRLQVYEASIQRSNAAALRKDPGLQPDDVTVQLNELLRMARREGNRVFWETGSLSTSIEATGYALLALNECPPILQAHCLQDAVGARAWLASHINAAGGFLSTQDTLIALEALTSWSSIHQTKTDLNVTSSSGDEKQSANLPMEYSNVPVIMKMKIGERLTVGVEGTGCALVQATRSYNTLSGVNNGGRLTVRTSVRTDGPFDCDADQSFCFCAAVVEACVLWTDSFPEMALLEMTLPGGFGADAARIYEQMQKPHTLIRRIELSPSGHRASIYLGSRDGGDVTSSAHCVHVHAVGPRGRTKPAYVKIMDYYNPLVNDSQVYTIPEDCPPSITHVKPKFIQTDNLYKSARSNDDSLVISEDFTFEDIPEGIPLDDPLYNNLKVTDDEANFESNENYTNVDVFDKENLETEFTLSGPKDDEIVEDKVQKDNLKTVEEKDSSQLNPNLKDFHVIDRESDLDVPTGVEGPVPVVVMPPQGFVRSSTDTSQKQQRGYYSDDHLYTLHYEAEYPYPVYVSPPRYYRSVNRGR